MRWRIWMCKVFGHRCETLQSAEIASFVCKGHWCWPGCITYCPRCGFIWKNVDGPPTSPEFK